MTGIVVRDIKARPSRIGSIANITSNTYNVLQKFEH